MSTQPAVTGKQVVRALERAGFLKDRQKGSHLILRHPQRKVRVVVPCTPEKPIKKALFAGILSEAGLSLEQFRDLL
jgi:predicted RNA binding protein YcfA (HicA-like mRNA interferase family)